MLSYIVYIFNFTLPSPRIRNAKGLKFYFFHFGTNISKDTRQYADFSIPFVIDIHIITPCPYNYPLRIFRLQLLSLDTYRRHHTLRCTLFPIP